jgi:hypothetical protein
MKTRKELEKLYLESYEGREVVFIVAILSFAVILIIIGLSLPAGV